MVVNGNTSKVLLGELELETSLLGHNVEDANGLLDDLWAFMLACCL